MVTVQVAHIQGLEKFTRVLTTEIPGMKQKVLQIQIGPGTLLLKIVLDFALGTINQFIKQMILENPGPWYIQELLIKLIY